MKGRAKEAVFALIPALQPHFILLKFMAWQNEGVSGS